MEIGDLVKVDYGENFGPPCIFLGWTQLATFRHGIPSKEWLILMDTQGRKFEAHIDYIYRISKSKDK